MNTLKLTARRRNTLSVLAVLALGLGVGSTASAAELVRNGDFEANGGSLDGWTVSAGSVLAFTASAFTNCCGTTGSEPGFSSDHFATFGANNKAGPHVLSQNIYTTPGQTYHLNFSMGALGLDGNETLFIGPLGDQDTNRADAAVLSNFDLGLNHYSMAFTATQTITTLQFYNLSTGIDGHDPILDNVSVSDGVMDGGGSAVPEPATWALMMLGFGGVGASLRRGRRAPGPRMTPLAVAIPAALGLLALGDAANAAVVELPVVTSPMNWTQFQFEGAGQAWDDSFHFVLSAPAMLQVVDGYSPGDIFDVVVNGVDFGHTTTVTTNDWENQVDHYDNALNSFDFSHGVWELAAGEYTVTGSSVLSPYLIGNAAIRLVAIDSPTGPGDPVGPGSSVPEPAEWSLLLTGFFAIGGMARTRRRQALA